MHTLFNPKQIDWLQLVAAGGGGGGIPQWGGGGHFIAFRGMPYQRGAGVGAIFRSLMRYLMMRYLKQ